MVPVRVRQEQGEIERLGFEFREQRLAEVAQAGAGVEDDDVRAGTKFDTTGVPAITNGTHARRRNRPPDSPEPDLGCFLDGEL